MNIREKIEKRREQDNFRYLPKESVNVDFASNDYLGLARSETLCKNVAEEVANHGCGLGSTGARLLTGNTAYAEELESSIAAYHGAEGALLFNCGYMANMALMSSVADYRDSVIFDTYIHASTHDGIRLSRCAAFPFRHNALDHLEKRLKQSSHYRQRFICVESVYSTDGSIAPLKEINSLCRQYDAQLIVDEAHAVGVFGPQGRGLVAAQGLTKSIFATVITFGKALGCHGAAIVGSGLLKHYLINFARPWIFTTASPRHMLISVNCAYKLLPTLDKERVHLNSLIQRFGNSSTPIQPVYIAGNQKLKDAAELLRTSGFDVCPLMSPTVQRKHECLRICLHAFNSHQQVTELLEVLSHV